MNHSEPPRLATWMLEHLMPGDRNEALAGDLLEELRAGRSIGWYRRQVVAAIAAGWLRGVFDHRIELFFAAIWSILVPAWQLSFERFFWQSSFIGHIWRIPWPWSTVCMAGLSTAEDLIFILAGALVYVTILAGLRRTVDFRRLRRRFAMSVVVFWAAWACELALLFAISTKYTAHAVDWRTLTLLGVIVNFGPWTALTRFPYLVGTACALWGATSRVAKTEGIPG